MVFLGQVRVRVCVFVRFSVFARYDGWVLGRGSSDFSDAIGGPAPAYRYAAFLDKVNMFYPQFRMVFRMGVTPSRLL